MADLCRRLAIDVLIPGVDEELPLAPEVTAQIPRVTLLMPAEPFVALMKDKLASMQALVAAGIDAPRTTTIDRAEDIGMPCLVKPRDGRGSRGVQVLHGRRELEAYQTLARRPADQLVAQELLEGREWTVYVAADRTGRLRGVVPTRR